MSYDLHILSQRRPKRGLIAEFVSSRELSIRGAGDLKPNGQLLLDDGTGAYAEVDGPFAIETEDVPEGAAGAIASSGWLVTISVKGSTSVEWPQQLATEAARATKGVVYDPQEDAVIWPKGWRPRRVVNGREIIDEVELCWSVIRAPGDPDLPATFLKLLREHFPAALPRRYGGFEPLPHRFTGENADEAFVERWVEEAHQGVPMLFWTANRPWFDGRVRMTSASPRAGVIEQPCVTISASLDARACYRDPALTETTVDLFRHVAVGLECVHAAAWVLRGVLLPKGGNPAYRGGPEVGPMPFGTGWVGLPAGPTWLAWFGKPYAELVRPVIAPHIAAEFDNGLFMRLGAEPLHGDELVTRFPPLPAELLARRKGRSGRWMDGAPYTYGTPPPSEPAELIPRGT